MKKPPYYIPSMNEINAIKPNGFNIISTFSGIGGSCLGYRMAGYKVLWANEFIPLAQRIYRLNHYSKLCKKDIRKVSGKEILQQTNLKVGNIDIFDGSPPCDSFTILGKRSRGWGKEKNYHGIRQQTDDLFFEYLRLAKELRPKIFVAENVVGLMQGQAKKYLWQILKIAREIGYNVRFQLLHCKYLGIPTSRRRLYIIGIRNDIEEVPIFPKYKDYIYTFGDAMKDVRNDSYRNLLGYDKGNKYRLLKKKKRKSTRYFHLTSFSQPLPTVTGQVDSLGYHTKPATLTITEIKRCSSFPDDFKLLGTYNQKYQRIGLAVPPFLAKELGLSLSPILERYYEKRR